MRSRTVLQRASAPGAPTQRPADRYLRAALRVRDDFDAVRRFVVVLERVLFLADRDELGRLVLVLRRPVLPARERLVLVLRDDVRLRGVLPFRAVLILRALVFRGVADLVRDLVELRFAFRVDFLPEVFRRDWPDSDIAIAIACRRLLAFLPERPLLRSPSLYSCMTFLTLPRCRLVAIGASA
jgi:hypothetical protein